MVNSEQLPIRRLPKFFFAALATTAYLFVFGLSRAAAQSGKIYRKASSAKGITHLLASTCARKTLLVEQVKANHTRSQLPT